MSSLSHLSSPSMKPISFHKYLFSVVTLGLLCGWYFVLLVAVPVLLFVGIMWNGFMQKISWAVLGTLLFLSIVPLRHEPWEDFMYSWIFKWWIEYFDMTYDSESISGPNALKKGQKYFFFEFPHGIFPMGQFLSAALIEELTPGHMICGTGADVVFAFPVMRHIFAWLGTHPASKSNIAKIFKKGFHCAVMPGGIAEMYLVSDEKETIFLKKRRNTVKLAIQEGANIVVLFAFGNTKLFSSPSKDSSSSFLARISRKLRASIVFFWPVPKRHPIKLVTGDIVPVQQCDNPSEEQIDDVMDRVIKSIEKLYAEKKPKWEKRPLVIT